MGFVTVNQKALVVIPKPVRDKCGIEPGDRLKVTYDEKDDTVIMKKIRDVKEISASVFGMWKDNKFDFDNVRLSTDDRIKKLLANKLQ